MSTNPLINVSISQDALPWIYLAVMAIAVVAGIASAMRRRGPAEAPAAPAIYRLLVTRTNGASAPRDVTFEDGRRLTAYEESTFDDLFRSFHPAEGVEDPDAFVEKVLAAYHDGTGIRGQQYMTPVVARFGPCAGKGR